MTQKQTAPDPTQRLFTNLFRNTRAPFKCRRGPLRRGRAGCAGATGRGERGEDGSTASHGIHAGEWGVRKDTFSIYTATAPGIFLNMSCNPGKLLDLGDNEFIIEYEQFAAWPF
ncbi:hypothetical protein PG999_004414 [Apiospora kogelbergensis]|uniref:Uncharacterized protein n=1 Tax=Apiospora kogelbergensis TaxID=1337665 RepID=A0AAW0QZC1_9PEZI